MSDRANNLKVTAICSKSPGAQYFCQSWLFPNTDCSMWGTAVSGRGWPGPVTPPVPCSNLHPSWNNALSLDDIYADLIHSAVSCCIILFVAGNFYTKLKVIYLSSKYLLSLIFFLSTRETFILFINAPCGLVLQNTTQQVLKKWEVTVKNSSSSAFDSCVGSRIPSWPAATAAVAAGHCSCCIIRASREKISYLSLVSCSSQISVHSTSCKFLTKTQDMIMMTVMMSKMSMSPSWRGKSHTAHVYFTSNVLMY